MHHSLPLRGSESPESKETTQESSKDWNCTFTQRKLLFSDVKVYETLVGEGGYGDGRGFGL